MAYSYGSPSTGGGAQNFRVGYEWSGWSTPTSGSLTATGTIQFFVRNAQEVSNDQQTFNISFGESGAGTLTVGGLVSPDSVEITNTQILDNQDRNIGPVRTVTYTYGSSEYGSSPGNFTGTITGLGSTTPLAKGFYVGGAATHTWSLAIPARPGAVPSAPTSVTSTPNNGYVSISFGTPSTNDPATTLYQYSVDDGASGWNNVTVIPFNHNGPNGTAITIYVKAINAVGHGPSASATSTPRTVPNAPTVSSTPSNGSISVSFSGPTTSPDNGGATVTYHQYSTDNINFTTASVNPTIFAGTNGVPITVYVKAGNVAGVGVAASTTSTPRTTPSAPAAPSVTRGNGSVAVLWASPNDGGNAISDYSVQYSSNSGSTWTTFTDGVSTSTSTTVTGLSNGTAYVFRVAAINDAGTGSYSSASSSVTPATTPGAPTSVTATPGNVSASVSWTAPASNGDAITDYVVQFSSNSGSTWSTFADGTSSSTSATVTGLTNGTSYVFRVAATNSVGTGSYSSASSAVTPRTVPGAPTSFTGNNNTFGQITLSWAAPSSDGGNAVSSYVLRTGATILQNTSATSYVHTGLSPYTDYSYTVTAANAAGEGAAASLTIKTMGGVVNIATATPSTYAKILPKICTNATPGSQVFTESQARVWDGTEWKHGI